MNKKWIAAGAILFFMADAVFLRMAGGKEEPAASVPPAVETVKPEIADIRIYTSLIGEAEPEQEAGICAETGGTATEVFVKAGDTVTAGQEICIIDTKQVESARNTMENAQVVWEEAKNDLGRISPLYQSGYISAQEYESYVNSEKKAEISLRQAKEEYERQYSYSHITAPVSGTVELCSVERFQRVSAGEELCVVSGGDGQWITTSLTENLRFSIAVGDRAGVEKNGRIYTGIISELSEMADPATGLFQAKILLSEAEHFAAGSSIRLSFCSGHADSVLTVPVDAVSYENSLPYLYTLEDGTVHKIFLETGLYDSERMEVKSGITADDEVIITWSSELFEGAQVRKLEETAAKSEENI